VRYVREGGQYAGHNPLGALSVLVLLGLLLTQALSGTMSRDDLLFEGPFSYWAGDFSGTMTDWHEINWRLLQGFVALHLASIGWYQWRKRQPLLQAMWRGEAGHKFSPLPPKPLLLAVMILLSAAALLWALVSVAPEAPSYY
jgi:cytochrome b